MPDIPFPITVNDLVDFDAKTYYNGHLNGKAIKCNTAVLRLFSGEYEDRFEICDYINNKREGSSLVYRIPQSLYWHCQSPGGVLDFDLFANLTPGSYYYPEYDGTFIRWGFDKDGNQIPGLYLVTEESENFRIEEHYYVNDKDVNKHEYIKHMITVLQPNTVFPKELLDIIFSYLHS
jgi:hypothetical protein